MSSFYELGTVEKNRQAVDLHPGSNARNRKPSIYRNRECGIFMKEVEVSQPKKCCAFFLTASDLSRAASGSSNMAIVGVIVAILSLVISALKFGYELGKDVGKQKTRQSDPMISGIK